MPIQILVYAETDEALEFAKKQIPVVMGRMVSGPNLNNNYCYCNTKALLSIFTQYTNLYLPFCYVHPEGIEEPDLTMKFQGRQKQNYGVVKVSVYVCTAIHFSKHFACVACSNWKGSSHYQVHPLIVLMTPPYCGYFSMVLRYP